MILLFMVQLEDLGNVHSTRHATCHSRNPPTAYVTHFRSFNLIFAPRSQFPASTPTASHVTYLVNTRMPNNLNGCPQVGMLETASAMIPFSLWRKLWFEHGSLVFQKLTLVFLKPVSAFCPVPTDWGDLGWVTPLNNLDEIPSSPKTAVHSQTRWEGEGCRINLGNTKN